VIKILENEFFPADLILISSSEPSGNAFIETSSLDGEKNLKVRKAYNQTNKYNCE
jgi:phospholipid-transporting ATPase